MPIVNFDPTVAMVTYGAIPLRITVIDEYTKTPMLDANHNYLYTRHRLGVRLILHDKATSIDDVPSEVLGINPADTIVNARHTLAIPRQPLKFILAGATILSCPKDGQTCDASGGPKIVEFRLLRSFGYRSMEYRWVVECDVIEARDEEDAAVDRTILSHSWGMREAQDRDWFATREVQGRAIFNRAVLEALNAANPPVLMDDYRASFFHPIADGWKREDVQVWVDEDACSLRYSFVDREMPINIDRLEALGVTRIEASHSTDAGTPGYVGAAFQMGASLAGGALAYRGSRLGQGTPDPVGARLQLALTAVQVLSHAVTPAPIIRVVVTCSVTGRWGASRANLEDIARAIIIARLRFGFRGRGDGGPAGIQAGQQVGGTRFYNNHDLMTNTVSCQAEQLQGQLDSHIGGNETWFWSDAPRNAGELVFADSTQTPGFTNPRSFGTVLRSGRVRQPRPPFGLGTRGNLIISVVANVLSDPGNVIPDPVNFTPPNPGRRPD